MPHPSEKAMSLAKAFHEVKHNTPRVVKHTAAKFGKARAEKQRVAIALSKHRRGY